MRRFATSALTATLVVALLPATARATSQGPTLTSRIVLPQVEVRLKHGHNLSLAGGEVLAREAPGGDRLLVLGPEGEPIRSYPADARLIKDRFGSLRVEVAGQVERVGRLTSDPVVRLPTAG